MSNPFQAERERRINRAHNSAERKRHDEAMALCYLPDVPKEIADMVYSYAWTEGHSGGYSEVENYYIEIADLAARAYKKGLKDASTADSTG